jgi:hypothetical protein
MEGAKVSSSSAGKGRKSRKLEARIRDFARTTRTRMSEFSPRNQRDVQTVRIPEKQGYGKI